MKKRRFNFAWGGKAPNMLDLGGSASIGRDADPYQYGTWIGGIRVGWWNGRCKACFRTRTPEGHDPCIANLPGVKNACCGHGGETTAYCEWEDGVVEYWQEDSNGHFIATDTKTP